MKTLKDAMLLLVVILIVTTVRIAPLPEARLSQAQAGQADQAAEVETVRPAVEAGTARPEAPPACESTLAVQTTIAPEPAPDPGQNPCDA